MKINYIFSAILFITFLFLSNAFSQSSLGRLTSLSAVDKPPIVYENQILPDGFRSFFFDGTAYQGKPTRIFAYYKEPKGKGPFPAVVLVHGGGGTAFKKWIEKWNDAGFAAISIAVEGQIANLSENKESKWQKHEYGGPSRAGIYEDSDKPLVDQWMFHATAATINAHNLLRSFESIKSDEIGLSGISWGGVITSTVMGFDQRFTFAIPIYGSGFLSELDNQYGNSLKNNDIYRDVWEPALRIDKFETPTFWLTGLHEKHFSLISQARTYKLLKAHHVQSVQPKLNHGHQAGWSAEEPYLFAQSVINKQALVSFFDQKVSGHSVSIKLESISDISSASLYFTQDVGHTSTREWIKVAAKIKKEEGLILLTATLPSAATAWMFNIEKDGLIYSSELSERVIQPKVFDLVNF